MIRCVTYKVTNTLDKTDDQNVTSNISEHAQDNPGFHFTNVLTA